MDGWLVCCLAYTPGLWTGVVGVRLVVGIVVVRVTGGVQSSCSGGSTATTIHASVRMYRGHSEVFRLLAVGTCTSFRASCCRQTF